MPTLTGNGISLNQQLVHFPYLSANAVPDLAYDDLFAWNAANLALSTFMIQPGNVSASEVNLGPVATGNITFKPEVTYHGLVTYNWDSRCESAESEISYSVLVNTTDPSNSALIYSMPAGDGFHTWNSSLSTPSMILYPNSTQFAGLGYDTSVGGFDVLPFGDTLYFMTGL